MSSHNKIELSNYIGRALHPRKGAILEVHSKSWTPSVSCIALIGWICI